MTITRDDHKLSIGKDFVDSVYMKEPKAHGTVEFRPFPGRPAQPVYTWISAFDCVASEKAIRHEARLSGLHILLFTSQAV